MNSRIYILILVCLLPVACTGQHYSDAVIARMDEPKSAALPSGADTLFLDTGNSEIAWKGTKMWGRGMHTGTVPVREGFLLVKDKKLAGGIIVVDMTGIAITDIPPDQPEPIRILTNHLEDELFFDTERYPEATFIFTKIDYISEDELSVSGNLTVKDVTGNITIPAYMDSTGRRITTRFRVNRFDWNIAYRGGYGATWFADRNFVDRYIEIKIRIEWP